MKDFHSRKKESYNFFHSPLFVFLLFLVLVLLVKSVYSSHNKQEKTNIEHKKIEELYNKLKKEHTTKIERNSLLKTDEGIKKELKDKYNVGENGETIIYIVR